MYSMILGAVIGAVLGSLGFISVGGPVGAIVGFFIGAVLATLVFPEILPMKIVVSKPIKLVAMRSSDGVSGTFVWGTGSINNSTVYNFMQLLEDGFMVPSSLPANHLVHLIEDSDLQKTGSWTTSKTVADPNSALYRWAMFTGHRTQIVRQEFRVPVGTVVQQFNIK